MEAFLNSFLLVALSEMGDKTQLLALVLAARFRRTFPVLAGILVATLLNHALASYAGAIITGLVPAETLKWILGASFIVFGLWMLKPDRDEPVEEKVGWGPFATTAVLFFLAEMGDKTQLATVALGAKYAAPFLVTAGTTAGMMAADGLAVYFGANFTGKIPMRALHRTASAIFILFGIAILVGF